MDLTTLERLPLWIGGRAVSARTKRYGEITNPATGEVVRHVPFATAEDIANAVAAATAALPAWRAAPPLRRARILMRFRDLLEAHKKDLAKLVSQEHGKTVADAEGSITRGIEVVEFATGIPHLLKGEFSDNVGTDADLKFAAEALIGAAYGSAGERCMAVSAVVAVGDAGDPLRELLAERVRRISVGPGDRPDSEMRPVITCAARDRIMGLIDRGVAEGAALVVDGRKPGIAGHENGFFVGPTLFDCTTPKMAIYREEIFGPVLVIVRSESLEEAIALINANRYANGAALFTRSGYAARHFQQHVEVGMVGINVPIPVPMAFYSFGGWRNSLFGDLHVHGM